MTSLGFRNPSGSLQEFDLVDVAHSSQKQGSKSEEGNDKVDSKAKEDSSTSGTRASGEPTQQLLQLNCVCCCFSQVVCECSQARMEQSQWEVEKSQNGRVIMAERPSHSPAKSGAGDAAAKVEADMENGTAQE